MQIVVAGAGGFIGSEVVAQALASGHQVFALVRDQTRAQFDSEAVKTGQLVSLPLGADPEVFAQGFGLDSGARWILAAGLNRGRGPTSLRQAHETLTEDVLSAATTLAAERVILLSCLGAAPKPASDDPWASSKLGSEALVRAAGRPWAVVRPAPVYGVGDTLLDEVGAWLHRSPFIPRFLEDVSLQPVYVGDVAEALLMPGLTGDLALGGEALQWGELLQACAAAAGKTLLGPTLAEATLDWMASTFGDRGWLPDLVPFDSGALARHRAGYLAPDNALPRLLGRPPRALPDYLATEWAYRFERRPRRSAGTEG